MITFKYIISQSMIHSFRCKNFYSFQGAGEVSFVVNKNAPKNDGYFKALSGTRLSKFETVIGANASGKTNLLKVLPLMKWLIIDSFERAPSKPLPIKPFMHGNEDTELSVDFEISKNIYTYSFVLNKNRILFEELKVKNKTNKKLTEKKVFSREWNAEESKYNLEDKNFNLPKDFKKLLRVNASVVSTATRLNHKESQEIINFWHNIKFNVKETGWEGDGFFDRPESRLLKAMEFYGENEEIKKEAEKVLRRFDLGLEGFEVKKEKDEDGIPVFELRVQHSFYGKKKMLALPYESSGTKQLFILLRLILVALKNGGTVIIDEFDAHLHPLMTLALFELFLHPEKNPKNAQLLFSTHSHSILNSLDKYQIILTEKSKDGCSEAWRLDEMEGVRPDDNYYSKYITGAYGAVPEL